MAIELNFSNEGSLEFQPGLPPGYSGPVLSGAKAICVKTNLVSMSIQELEDEDYSIRFSISRFLKRMTAHAKVAAHGVYSFFNLKSGLRKEIDGIGRFHIRQDQYACFYAVPRSCTTRFDKNTEYRIVDIFYSPRLLEELMPFFPELKQLVASNKGSAITQKAHWAFPAMKEIVNQLLNCRFDENTRKFYFDLKVRELLFQMLENTYRQKADEYFFTQGEIKRILDVKSILENCIAEKPPLMRELARDVGLNEFKLKAGFRQYFGTGIFEWLLEKKMQYARDLLLTTDMPLKQVCELVGYPRVTNFITAFRRRFAATPASLRRRR